MKLLKKSTYRQKFNPNYCLISSLTMLGFLLTPVAIANVDTTVLFRPPPKERQPETTEGTASRQNRECSQDLFVPQQQESLSDRAELTAVIPDSNYGLTVSAHPTFWVYLPKTSAKQAILTVKEEGINPHWQQSISLTGEDGIIGIKLSDDAPALEIGKNYQWAVILVCDRRPNPNDPVVAAWIKRVDEYISRGERPFAPTAEGSTAPTEAQTDPNRLDRAAWYAEKGIWYDALDILVEERKSSLDNWNDIWVKYLQSGGLDTIANKPVIINPVVENGRSPLR